MDSAARCGTRAAELWLSSYLLARQAEAFAGTSSNSDDDGAAAAPQLLGKETSARLTRCRTAPLSQPRAGLSAMPWTCATPPRGLTSWRCAALRWRLRPGTYATLWPALPTKTATWPRACMRRTRRLCLRAEGAEAAQEDRMPLRETTADQRSSRRPPSEHASIRMRAPARRKLCCSTRRRPCVCAGGRSNERMPLLKVTRSMRIAL